MAEKKIMDIEEELKIVGANMQTLEMSEEKTMKREEGLQEEILELRLLFEHSRHVFHGTIYDISDVWLVPRHLENYLK